VALIERYGDIDLTKLHYAELDRLRDRLDRLVGEDAEPFEPEELALLPFQSTVRVEYLRDRVGHELALRDGMFVTIGGRSYLRVWWQRPEDARRFLSEREERRQRSLNAMRPSRGAAVPSIRPRTGRARRRVVHVRSRSRRRSGSRGDPSRSSDDEPDPPGRALARLAGVLSREAAT
jgi:hypothetical protein